MSFVRYRECFRPEILQKWTTALESGGYQQAQHMLMDTDTDAFCCLGVLCDIVQEDVATTWSDGGFGGNFAVPPENVLHYARNPNVPPETIRHVFSALAEANDAGVGFMGIAQMLKQGEQDSEEEE